VLNLDGNRLPLSELAVAMQYASNYYLGDQINVFFTKQVITPGQSLDLSSEAVILGQNTIFTVYDKNGKQVTDVKVNNGKLTFPRAGLYTVKMTNPYVLSQGEVAFWNEEEQYWEPTNVHGWLASATSWQRVFQSNYQNVYGYNINNAKLAGALDQGMANGFRPSGNFDTLLIEADSQSPGEGAVIFNQATGEQLALGRHGIVITTAKPFMNNVQGMYTGLAGGLQPGQQRAGVDGIQLAQAYVGSDAPQNLYPAHNPWRMNFTPLGGWGSHGGADNIQGYDVTQFGGFLTLDHTWQDFMLGGAFSFAQTQLDYDNFGSESDADSMAIALYGRQNFGPWFIGGQVGVGHALVDNKRSIPAIGLNAKSDYTMYWYQAGLSAGYDVEVGQSSVISPSLGIAYLGSHSEGFTEKGAGNLNLEVDSESMNSLEVQGIVEAQTTFTTQSGMRIIPRLKLGLGYELADENAVIHTRFNEIPEINGFEAESADPGRLRAIMGAGVDLSLSETVSVAIDYEGSLQQDYQYHQGSVSLKLEF